MREAFVCGGGRDFPLICKCFPTLLPQGDSPSPSRGMALLKGSRGHLELSWITVCNSTHSFTAPTTGGLSAFPVLLGEVLSRCEGDILPYTMVLWRSTSDHCPCLYQILPICLLLQVGPLWRREAIATPGHCWVVAVNMTLSAILFTFCLIFLHLIQWIAANCRRRAAVLGLGWSWWWDPSWPRKLPHCTVFARLNRQQPRDIHSAFGTQHSEPRLQVRITHTQKNTQCFEIWRTGFVSLWIKCHIRLGVQFCLKANKKMMSSYGNLPFSLPGLWCLIIEDAEEKSCW